MILTDVGMGLISGYKGSKENNAKLLIGVSHVYTAKILVSDIKLIWKSAWKPVHVAPDS